jgi:hypothetical protein
MKPRVPARNALQPFLESDWLQFPGESVSLEQASGELMATMVLELRQ